MRFKETQAIGAGRPLVDDLFQAVVVGIVVHLDAEGFSGRRGFDVDLATVQLQQDLQ